MAKEDFSLKKDVLQLQKKTAELELDTTELKETLSKFNLTPVEDLKQRVEDIEDLVMVENAGLIELKNMLEGAKPEKEVGMQTNPEVEGKIKSLEEKVGSISIPNIEEIKNSVASSLPSAPILDTSKYDQSMEELKTLVDSLKGELTQKLGYVERRFSKIENNLSMSPDFTTLKTDLKHEILSSLPNYESARSDVQSMLETLKSDFEHEKDNLQTTLDVIKQELSQPLPERAAKELEKIRHDWSIKSAKMEAVEKFVENFSNELNNIKPIIAKLETFDKLVNLHEEISDNLKSFKEFQDHMADSVEKNETVEKRIQREVNKLKETGKEVLKIDDSLSRLEKEVDKINKELSGTLKRDELESLQTTINSLKSHVDKFAGPVEDRIDSVDLKISDLQGAVMSLDKGLESTKKELNITHDDMSIFQGNLMPLEQNRSDLTASIADLQETKVNMQKQLKSNENTFASLKKEMLDIRNDLADIVKKHPKKEEPEVAKKINSLEAEIEAIKSLKPEDRTSELFKKINELENKIGVLSSPGVLDEQLSEIISRLVFLESRIVGMEGMLQDMPRYSPIVVE